jgi:Fic family protein
VAEINISCDTQHRFDKEIKLYNQTQKNAFNLSNINTQLQTNILELKQDINVHIDHIKSLKYLNTQLQERLNKIEKENEQLKLQIIEKKQNNIITFYC